MRLHMCSCFDAAWSSTWLLQYPMSSFLFLKLSCRWLRAISTFFRSCCPLLISSWLRSLTSPCVPQRSEYTHLPTLKPLVRALIASGSSIPLSSTPHPSSIGNSSLPLFSERLNPKTRKHSFSNLPARLDLFSLFNQHRFGTLLFPPPPNVPSTPGEPAAGLPKAITSSISAASVICISMCVCVLSLLHSRQKHLRPDLPVLHFF
mmetsp:Transcript_16629/g.38386  ORF Transcript_16629/g.38386 Transcript_16629/m.38386 type:complete len:205 (-) Transcript_16629:822-1436(-)